MFFFNHRGQRLAGTVHRPAGRPAGGVVICHGMLSHRGSEKHRAIAAELAARGQVAFRFDFAGRGDSEGRTQELTYEGEVADLAAAAALVRREVEPLSLVGSSMGGAVAVLYAAGDRQVRRLATVATVGRPGEVLDRLGGADLERAARERGTFELAGYRLGSGLIASSRAADVVGAARSLSRPWLLIHGDQDEVVPLAQARELARVAEGARLEVIPGGDHVFHRPEHQEWLVRRIGEFICLA